MSFVPRNIVTRLAPRGSGGRARRASPIEQGEGTCDAPSSRYIVTVNAGNDPKAVADGKKAKTKYVYRSAVNGFAAELSDAQVSKLRQDSRVAAIEQDRVVTADATQTNATWGLDRIDQRNLPLSTTYTYNSTGAGVFAYVIDTGICVATRSARPWRTCRSAAATPRR